MRAALVMEAAVDVMRAVLVVGAAVVLEAAFATEAAGALEAAFVMDAAVTFEAAGAKREGVSVLFPGMNNEAACFSMTKRVLSGRDRCSELPIRAPFAVMAMMATSIETLVYRSSLSLRERVGVREATLLRTCLR